MTTEYILIKRSPCYDCKGTGYEGNCTTCDGEGVVEEEIDIREVWYELAQDHVVSRSAPKKTEGSPAQAALIEKQWEDEE